MQERIKELIENHTIDELAQMVVDLEAELSVKENMKIVEDCIRKDKEESENEIEKIHSTLRCHAKELSGLLRKFLLIRKEIDEIREEISEIGEKNDKEENHLHEQENEMDKAFTEIRKKRTRPVKMTIHEADLSDMFDELTKSRERERSEMSWFYDIFNQRFFK